MITEKQNSTNPWLVSHFKKRLFGQAHSSTAHSMHMPTFCLYLPSRLSRLKIPRQEWTCPELSLHPASISAEGKVLKAYLSSWQQIGSVLHNDFSFSWSPGERNLPKSQPIFVASCITTSHLLLKRLNSNVHIDWANNINVYISSRELN